MDFDWDLDRLEAAFRELFGCQPGGEKGFDNRDAKGLSDGNQGVQWNVYLDRPGGFAFLGVNLEGMKYDGWPIARFIERELARSRLADVVHSLQDPAGTQLIWFRDAWQAAARLPIREQYLGGTPVHLSAVTGEHWRGMLKEAYQCLEPAKSYRGRATQRVTLLKRGTAVLKTVSPHLQFRRPARPGDWRESLTAARGELQPIYEFVRRQSLW